MSNEETWLQSVAWHAVANRRISQGKAFLDRPALEITLLVVAIINEPFRWLHGWFMYHAGDFRRKKAGAEDDSSYDLPGKPAQEQASDRSQEEELSDEDTIKAAKRPYAFWPLDEHNRHLRKKF